jgi:hypothetical protein
VTRRPKSRLPRKLPDPARERPQPTPRPPSRRERLKDAHAAGRSTRWSRDSVVQIMGALVRGDADSALGLPPFEGLTMDHARAAAELIFGWSGDGPRARIDPARTVNSFTGAAARVLEVARSGGRIAFATGRPASLLGLHRALADAAKVAGGDVLAGTPSPPIDGKGRRLWWIDDVATVSDGESLLADDSPAAADELLFLLPRPHLLVGDRAFAGAAAASGLEVVAFADLDAIALAIAAWRGMAVRLVPLDEHRAPQAYEPLLELLAEVARAPEPGPEVADFVDPSDVVRSV